MAHKIGYVGTQSCPSPHFSGGLWSCTNSLSTSLIPKTSAKNVS